MKDLAHTDIQIFDKWCAQAGHIAVVGHMRPDGDSLGSCLGMAGFLEMLGKHADIVFDDRYPETLDFMTRPDHAGRIVVFEEDKNAAESAITESDLVICLDFNAYHRAGDLADALSRSEAKKILIDHHLNPDRGTFDLIFSETEISSTSELLYHIMLSSSVTGGKVENIPLPAATSLFTGMTTDTNNFSNSVYPSTLEMASKLLGIGVDRDSVITHIYNEYRENRLRLLGYILTDLMEITEDGVSCIILDGATMQRFGIKEGETENFVNMPLSVDKVRLSVFIKEDEDFLRVSLRSKKGISANNCAALYFNGGGHEQAAGGKLFIPRDIPGISKAADYVKKVTHEFLTGQ